MPDRRIVALLPMKGHSERVQGKNVRDFVGRPLFRWILDTLLSIPEITRVVINTDARAMFRSHGLPESDRIVVRDRKPDICGDSISMNLVLADDVANVSADTYLMTHATNPLLEASTIRAALAAFDQARAEGRADSLFTVNRFQTRFYREDGTPVNHDPNDLRRTQDLEPWFEENSNLYIFPPESFHRTRARIGKRPLLFETSRIESVDIDDEEGWRIAELFARGRVASSPR